MTATEICLSKPAATSTPRSGRLIKHYTFEAATLFLHKLKIRTLQRAA